MFQCNDIMAQGAKSFSLFNIYSQLLSLIDLSIIRM